MDFSNLKGLPSQHIKFTSEQKPLRTLVYIAFANTNSLQELYSDVREKFKKYIDDNLLIPNYDKDILYYICKSVNCDRGVGEQARERLSVQVKAQPLLPSIKIAPEFKFINQVVSKMEKIGYQNLHVSILMKDSSSESESSDLDNILGLYNPKIKKFRTWQNAIEIDSESMLDLHTNRTANAVGICPNVDILIYMDSSFCKQLSKYLGLIYIEGILEEAEEKSINDILPRLNDKYSKLYRRLQTYINNCLVAGYNNVCLVHHFNLWQNINANVRAAICRDTDDTLCMRLSETSNFQIILGEQPSFLTYVEAVSIIIDKALNCNCHVIAKYKCGPNVYCKVKLSLSSIIPLYILRYFSQCKMLEHEFEL